MKIRQIDIKGERYDIEAFINPIPTGAVFPFAGITAPKGFLLCDGSAVSRVTYVKLFEVIGEIYGSGNGSTTFNLPNLIDKFIEGTQNEVGQNMSAGLPNIRGILHRVLCSGYDAFEPIEGSGDYGINALSGSIEGSKHDVRFLASKGELKTDGTLKTDESEKVFGKSNTVQPPAIKMQYIIKY